MKKKKTSDSGSDGCITSRSLRERKNKKVMPKLLAEEIDAEAKTDCVVGLKIMKHDIIKSSVGKVNFRELDLERALYRWYERYQLQRKEVSQANVQTILTSKELERKAKSLVQVFGGSCSLTKVITKSWISRWQERYGVPKREGENSDDASTSSSDSENENNNDRGTCKGPIKQRFKKGELKTTEDTEISSSVKVNCDENEERLRQILTIDTSQEAEVNPTEPLQPLFKLYTKDGLQEYGDDQIYFAFCFELNWTSLPDTSVESCNEEPVWLLMAANRSGRHRTRILVTGREWRPQCLKHVNMLSQPVVYAGGGKGALTPDLFCWWFRKEFVPAAESVNVAFVLVVEDKWVTSKLEEIADSRNIPLVSTSNPCQADWDLVVAEFKTRYITFLLKNLMNTLETTSVNSVTEYLKAFTLKDAFPLFHKAWLVIRSESFHRLSVLSWIHSKGKLSGNYSSLDEENNALINLSKENNEKIKDEYGSVNLTVKVTCKEERKEIGKLALTKKGNVLPKYVQEDRMLLLELQWLAHDVGLEVTDEDLSSWVLNRTTSEREFIKIEESEVSVSGEDFLPTANEAVNCLSKALLWMETQPLDPNFLLTVREIVEIAKQAC